MRSILDAPLPKEQPKEVFYIGGVGVQIPPVPKTWRGTPKNWRNKFKNRLKYMKKQKEKELNKKKKNWTKLTFERTAPLLLLYLEFLLLILFHFVNFIDKYFNITIRIYILEYLLVIFLCLDWSLLFLNINEKRNTK